MGLFERLVTFLKAQKQEQTEFLNRKPDLYNNYYIICTFVSVYT